MNVCIYVKPFVPFRIWRILSVSDITDIYMDQPLIRHDSGYLQEGICLAIFEADPGDLFQIFYGENNDWPQSHFMEMQAGQGFFTISKNLAAHKIIERNYDESRNKNT